MVTWLLKGKWRSICISHMSNQSRVPMQPRMWPELIWEQSRGRSHVRGEECKEWISLNMILGVFSCGCMSFPREPVGYVNAYVTWVHLCTYVLNASHGIKVTNLYFTRLTPCHELLHGGLTWGFNSSWTQVPSMGSLMEIKMGCPHGPCMFLHHVSPFCMQVLPRKWC